MSTGGPWYRTIKTIRGHQYIYDQSTRRVGRQILTKNRYIGSVGGRAIRLSYAGKEAGGDERTASNGGRSRTYKVWVRHHGFGELVGVFANLQEARKAHGGSPRPGEIVRSDGQIIRNLAIR